MSFIFCSGVNDNFTAKENYISLWKDLTVVKAVKRNHS